MVHGKIRVLRLSNMSIKIILLSEQRQESTNLHPPVMIAHPHSSSAVHHHGTQDTIVYAQSGHGTIISDNGNTRQDLSPGDFALIPAWTEHQEVNDGDEEVTWIITRSGGTPEVVNLEGWSGKTVS